jgi:hypothetical protein
LNTTTVQLGLLLVLTPLNILSLQVAVVAHEYRMTGAVVEVALEDCLVQHLIFYQQTHTQSLLVQEVLGHRSLGRDQ